jgi:hypothetical protein
MCSLVVMETSLAPAAYPVAVTDPLAVRPYDYADAFAADLPAPDPSPPETWMRLGLASVPAVADWVVGRLGFRSGGGDPLDDWEERTTGPEVLHLATTLPMMQVELIGRNLTPTRRTLTTLVSYTRPRLGRLVMTLIGPVHRRLAQRLVAGRTPPPRADA